MKKIKKALALTLALMMSVTTLAACKPKDEKAADPKTINVQMKKGSYGTNWLFTIAEKFEKAYAAEGYKVNILRPSSDMSNTVAVQEMAQGYAKTNVDMYVAGNLLGKAVGEQGQYGILSEEISSLWDKKAIGFNGQEESKTLKEKAGADTMELYKDAYGKIYTAPYIAMGGGMVVNTRKLALYGINTLPTTTGEMFDMWDKIYRGANGQANSETTLLFPFTYMPGSNNAYTLDWFTALMAQYDQKQYEEYYSWQTKNDDGSVSWWEGDVAKAAQSDAFLEALNVFTRAFDTNLAAYGTATQTLDQAQAQVMKESTGAIFMCCGNWFLNDMATAYADSLDDLGFMNFPVISALGDKIWADTVADAAKREEMLRYAISQVDDLNKAGNTQEIATDMTTRFGVEVTKEDVEEVRRARCTYFSRMESSTIVMTKGTTKRDICELFIRMIASDDAAAVISEQANATSAYEISPNTQNKYAYVRQASAVTSNPYAVGIEGSSKGYRHVLGKSANDVLWTGHIASHIVTTRDTKSIYDGNGGLSGENVNVYREFAQSIQQKELKFYQDNIATWERDNAEMIEIYRAIWQPKA